MAVDNVKHLRLGDLSVDHAQLLRLASAHAPSVGANRTAIPVLTLYRFDEPTRFRKLPVHGMTLGVVLQGAKRVRVGDVELQLEAGRFLVVTGENDQHSAVEKASSSQPYLGLSLTFDPERVARALISLKDVESSEASESAAFAMPFDRHIVNALHRLLLTLENTAERTLYAPLSIEEILLRILRSEISRQLRRAAWREPDAERILKAMAFIRAHLSKELTVERIAQHLAMSPSHFAHRFRDVTRVSPMQFVREVRLERAQELLVSRSLRVSEVALATGYESPSHFSREFVRRFGISPGRYAATPPL